MSGFDAELHLRLVGERMLLDGGDARRPRRGTPLESAAQALVAVEAIDERSAEAVLEDYGLAEGLRAHERHRALGHLAGRSRPLQPAPVPLGQRRVVACDRELETADGTIHVRYVSLGDDATRVGVSFRPAASAAGHIRRRRPARMPPPGHPPPLTLTDDRGTSAAAHFAGGGAEVWTGHYRVTPPLARDTAWIELDGERIELHDAVSPAAISVERLPDVDRAVRHLWRLVTSEHRHMGAQGPPEAAIDALIACGALAPGNPAIAETQTAREAIGHGPMGGGPGAPRLPNPWHSLLSRLEREDGPSGTVTFNAVTPPFDGISVALTMLESSADGWTAAVDVAPDVVMRGIAEQSARLRGIAWWATDNRGNHYLGEPGTWSGGGDHGFGEIGFWPTLDPTATELVVMPTAETERAVIRLPLDWVVDGAAGGGPTGGEE